MVSQGEHCSGACTCIRDYGADADLRGARFALIDVDESEGQRVSVVAQLPDGRVIKLGGERFEAPEALFNP